ncbi:MAG: hypothetical protein J6B25_04435 [Clostridia bacterium]|nr:hypothetical protein [Clostridia bacterium]MBR3815410.1 hypothetical protein [Clostridia bacterium]
MDNKTALMNEKIVSIYENIYNNELDWKRSLDDKFSSRLTLLVAITTASFVIFTTVFFPDSDNLECIQYNKQILCKILSLLSVTLLLCLCCSFYKCFFRAKKNYKVMPTVDIRMFHFYIHKNNLCGTKDEQDLYNYLNDSYQFCAYTNANINSKRESALIIFDNIASISFVLLIVTYVLMVRFGYSISWIF